MLVTRILMSAFLYCQKNEEKYKTRNKLVKTENEGREKSLFCLSLSFYLTIVFWVVCKIIHGKLSEAIVIFSFSYRFTKTPKLLKAWSKG